MQSIRWRAPERGAARRRAVLVAGWATSLAAIVGLVVPPAAAQSDTKPEAAKVEKQAYFTAEADGAVPATLTSEFPPGVVCILVPQVCSAQAEPVTGPVGGALEPVYDASIPDWQAPQAVEPGTLPVGMLGGKPRYTSYLKFALPTIPEGSVIDSFELIMTQAELSYALESPAFRQALLAALVSYQTSSPQPFADLVRDVATRTTPLATTAITGIELCAVAGPWEPVESGDASTQPPRDCIYGANGEFDPETETWSFDLSFLVQAWIDGTLPNEGVYLGPLGANNLAFGDPDTSTNWQVSLHAADATDPATRPKIAYSFMEGFDDDAFEEEADFGFDEGTSGDITTIAPTDPFSTAPFDDSALGGGVPQVTEPGPRGALRGTLAAQSSPRSPWWLWLLLPAGLAATYAYVKSIEQVPAATRAGRGALSRLMATSDSSPHI